ncbi:MAG TPA: hypothetical protein VLK25_10375 [Allosphingosinicella sp.]|nr:hypothetical protein [Allosphingosinicella sp.]
MRSETAPFWSSFLVGMGLILLFSALIWLATGQIKLKRDSYVRRDEQPEKFWAIIGGCVAVSLVSLAIAIPHFGPGG